MTKKNYQKKIFILGGGSDLANALIHESKNTNFKILLHQRFKRIKQHQSNIYDYLYGDIRDKNFLEKFQGFIEINKPDIYLNCIGSHCSENFENMNLETIRDAIDINILYPTLLLKKIYSYFLKNGGGTIINISSIASSYDTQNESLYSMGKSAMHKLHRCLRLESYEKNINIINILPGAFKSKMTKGRKNFDALPEPNELALLIYNFIELENFNVNELEIRRK